MTTHDIIPLTDDDRIAVRVLTHQLTDAAHQLHKVILRAQPHRNEVCFLLTQLNNIIHGTARKLSIDL